MSLNPITLLERWINEHGSADILGKHVAFFKDQLAILKEELAVLARKVESLEAENRDLKAKNAELRGQVEEREITDAKAAQANQSGDLPEIQHKLLVVLKDQREAVSAHWLAHQLGISEPLATHHLEQLGTFGESDYIHVVGYLGSPPDYGLAARGRAYLAQRNLL